MCCMRIANPTRLRTRITGSILNITAFRVIFVTTPCMALSFVMVFRRSRCVVTKQVAHYHVVDVLLYIAGISGTCPGFEKCPEGSVGYVHSCTKVLAPNFQQHYRPDMSQIHIGCPVRLQTAPIVRHFYNVASDLKDVPVLPLAFNWYRKLSFILSKLQKTVKVPHLVHALRVSCGVRHSGCRLVCIRFQNSS